MATSTLYFTESDHSKLSQLLDSATGGTDLRLRGDLHRLSDELKSANIVKSHEIPADVVTLNSQMVTRDEPDGEDETWTLTLPNEADVMEQKISVLSPLGTALLGTREGEIAEWSSDGRAGKVRVVKILFQPEAAGQYS